MVQSPIVSVTRIDSASTASFVARPRPATVSHKSGIEDPEYGRGRDDDEDVRPPPRTLARRAAPNDGSPGIPADRALLLHAGATAVPVPPDEPRDRSGMCGLTEGEPPD